MKRQQRRRSGEAPKKWRRVDYDDSQVVDDVNMELLLQTIDVTEAAAPLLSEQDCIPLAELAACSFVKKFPDPEDFVERLYRWKQCAQCGFRLSSPEEMAEHLDWHSQTSREQQQRRLKSSGQGRPGASRSWLLSEAGWSGTDPSVHPMEEQEEKEDDEGDAARIVVVKMGRNTCPICLEVLACRFDHEIDDWVFVDALRVEGELEQQARPECRGQVVHQICFAGFLPLGEVEDDQEQCQKW